MSKSEFLDRLRRALSGMAPHEIDDIVADYGTHFDEGVAAGRSEQDIAQALGDPERLARELRIEAGLRRWETQRTPGALAAAIAALGGMVALDLFILLPVLCVLAACGFVLGVVLFALALAGSGLLLSGLVHSFTFSGVIASVSRMLAGIGLLGASIGVTALLWLLLEGLTKLFARYARLHYRVLKPAGAA
jgi:uncharacterized membrane protein